MRREINVVYVFAFAFASVEILYHLVWWYKMVGGVEEDVHWGWRSTLKRRRVTLKVGGDRDQLSTGNGKGSTGGGGDP